MNRQATEAAMDTWEGSFGWQGYARDGRPDLLNYLRRGDVTWEELWAYYRERASSAEAVQRLTGLFHAFMSSEFDQAGCHLDEDGETWCQLSAWAAFAIEFEDLLPEAAIQEILRRLGDQGMVSGLYYNAVFSVYMETLLDRYAGEGRLAERVADRRDGLPAPEERRLGTYYPDAARFPQLSGEPAWRETLDAFLAGHYRTWNHAYAAIYTRSEEEALFQEVGGEG